MLKKILLWASCCFAQVQQLCQDYKVKTYWLLCVCGVLCACVYNKRCFKKWPLRQQQAPITIATLLYFCLKSGSITQGATHTNTGQQWNKGGKCRKKIYISLPLAGVKYIRPFIQKKIRPWTFFFSPPRGVCSCVEQERVVHIRTYIPCSAEYAQSRGFLLF